VHITRVEGEVEETELNTAKIIFKIKAKDRLPGA